MCLPLPHDQTCSGHLPKLRRSNLALGPKYIAPSVQHTKAQGAHSQGGPPDSDQHVNFIFANTEDTEHLSDPSDHHHKALAARAQLLRGGLRYLKHPLLR